MGVILIDGFPIDLSISETHLHESEVTEDPIESGSIVSDHILNQPIEVRIEGVVSDTPIGDMELLRDLDGGSDSTPSQQALAHFLAIRERRREIEIVTELKFYPSMALTSLEIERSRETTGGLFFSMTFREMIITQNVRAATRVAVPRAKLKTTTTKPPKEGKVVERRVMSGPGNVRPWFDPDIDEWRHDAVYDSSTGKWTFYKRGLLDGFEAATDQQYRDYIAKKRTEENGALVKLDKKTKKPIQNPGTTIQIIGDDPTTFQAPPPEPPELLRRIP